MCGSLVIFPLSAVLLCLLSFLLQIIALLSSHWAEWTARKDHGKQEESGHYGLWTLCSKKAPLSTDDCDPLDTFFKKPSQVEAAGYIAILHVILLLAFLPFAILRVVQIVRDAPKLAIRPSRLCIIKVSLAFTAVFFAILTTVLCSIGENRYADYVVEKGWAFWIQIGVLVADIFLGLVCALENIQYWQQQTLEAATRDPDGEFAETYGNPVFEPGTPHSNRHYGSEISIAYTDSSGRPYALRDLPPKTARRSGRSVERINTNGAITRDITDVHMRESGATVITIGDMMYENPSFKDLSPRSKRRYQRNFRS